ncbi:MAG: hypothetical protein IPM69_06090 [Ignavibacteria bacterium]|nr:hypothetical protein [Ignavibacteria bacterium]
MLRSYVHPHSIFLYKFRSQCNSTLYSLGRLGYIGVFLTVILSTFTTMQTNAQWGFVPNSFPPTELHNGLAGIGLFAPPPASTTFLPMRMLHLHSENFGVSTNTVYQPAFLRLQTQSQNFGDNSNVNYFGQAGIEFFSGSTQNYGAGGWCVGKILGITNGLGIDPGLPNPLYQPNDPAEIDLRGGLAFFCSLSKSASLPMETNREVMRIVDGMVGIGTTKPKEMLQIYEKMTFHVGANDYYMGYNQNTNNEIVGGAPQLVIRRFWDVPPHILEIDPTASHLSAAMGVMFKEDHNLMYLTNSGKGLAGSVVNLSEPSGAVKGITIGNTNNNVENNGDQATIGLGATADADSRVFIRGLSESSATKNALRVANSGELYGTPFTRFVVKDNGNVGIGIDVVKAKFQIGSRFGTYADNSNSIVTHNAYYDGAWKRISDGVAPGGKPAAISLSDGTISLKVGTASGMQQDAAITWTTALSVANDNKITIGTLAGTGSRAVYANASGELIAATEPSGWSLTGNDIGEDDFIGTKNNTSLIFKTNNVHRLQISESGDVNVGTLQWDYTATAGNLDQTVYPSLLSVNGAVVAKLVRVTVNHWADNVFSPGYRLMPLSEVREYIDENGHLPDVPAEAEVSKNGIDLQEMQAVLLRKVEELTLHLIKIEDENKSLRRRVDAINASLPIDEE